MMRLPIISAFVLLCGSNANAESPCKSSPCITVDVYYESLCGDSMMFIRNELVPSYPDLKDYLNINFIPYGKASTKLEESKKYSFTCQHGPVECQGNKAQGCGYDAILNSGKTYEEKQSLAVAFIGCAMSSDNPGTAVPECAKTTGLSEETRKVIDDCINSEKGDALLAGYGEKTHDLNPALTSVPTIILDGVYSKENQRAAESNFKKLICDRIPDKPAACSK
ncbi:gamma-interferon-inducible lysosomal thiol reductase [Fopius arisanus]|uniref:Gamma-interferon-inducible lysosomal thiol reductase n=1 Tax=Fopius arisanus TaxID=64838 RepID=A0A0C9R680_9HYME|nr:PREDICTED: gamma-interferon-inducible lysosomal thiol reductase-like [Fopius arisanus]